MFQGCCRFFEFNSVVITLPGYCTNHSLLTFSHPSRSFCTTGLGFDSLLKDLMAKAAVNGNKIHVMGAANVGKSSFINRLLETSSSGKLKAHKATAGLNRRARRAALAKTRQDALRSVARVTVSNLPGTTLDFLKIQLPNGIVMVDTPGLLQVRIIDLVLCRHVTVFPMCALRSTEAASDVTVYVVDG